jgi:hypothetical protein
MPRRRKEPGQNIHTDAEASVCLRLAMEADGPDLRRLAQLDSCRVAPGAHLVAERQGRIDAALALSSGAVMADPFRHTEALGELLRLHALLLRRLDADQSPPVRDHSHGHLAQGRPRVATA